MATGDDATAAGIPLAPGTALAKDIDEWINRLADELARRQRRATTPVTEGGTGGGSASAARDNLDVPWDATGSQMKFTSPAFDRIAVEVPGLAFPHTLAYTSDIPAAPDLSGYVAKSGDTMSGGLTVGSLGSGGNIETNARLRSTGARSTGVSSALVLYVDPSGFIGPVTSSRRFKKNIRDLSPDKQAILAMRLVEFRYKVAHDAGDTSYQPGLIAEELHDLGLGWLVIYDDDGQPFSVHYERIALALLPVMQDHEARLTALEGQS